MSDTEPISRADYAHLWIEITRRRLRGEWPNDEPLPEPPADNDAEAHADYDPDPLF